MKNRTLQFLLVSIAVSMLLPSCQGLNIESPYGDFRSSKNGVVYTPPPGPIFIPNYSSK